MALLQVVVLLGCAAYVVFSKPTYPEYFDADADIQHLVPAAPRIWKRFINPSLTSGSFTYNETPKLRTRRSSEEACEKLQLCKLHARSGHSFFASYELYFVNKENAKLWDHHAHTMANCEQRFSDCFTETPTHAQRHTQRHTQRQQVEFVDDDYER